MKRTIALVLALVTWPLVGSVPAADAMGVGGCVITGTINFTPPTGSSSQGLWRIEPGVIECQGFYEGRDRFLGPGPFVGSGTYTPLATGGATCLDKVGKGIVQYTIRTAGTDVRYTEAQEFVTAGAGLFNTPSLQGSFVEPPHEGNCLTQPVTRATFVAQAVMPRTTRN